MEGRHSSPSHAKPSSGRSSASSRSRSTRKEREADITDVRNEYAERRRSRDEQLYVRDGQGRRRTREPEAVEEYYEDTPARGSGRDKRGSESKGNRPSAIGEALRIIALAGVILLVFAFFNHVKDRIFLPEPIEIEPVIVSAMPTVTSPSEPELPTVTEEMSQNNEPEPEPEPDNRTEWQKKFEDKFTDEVVVKDNSYSSPNISVTIETFVEEVNGRKQTWYVADIYVASVDCLMTYFAKDTYIPGGCLDEPIESMCSATGAIFAVSGDYCSNQKNGFLVRNGQIIHDEPILADLCVLFWDGTVETYSPNEYTTVEILERGPWQSWKFGPKLLDENGRAMTTFNSGAAVINECAPRCGFGYYEPGHYCLVVNDGRLNHSSGFLLSEFALLFEKLGCTRAYNLDGGATAVMAFNGEKYSKPSANRNPGDIFYLWEPSYNGEEGER